MNTKPLGIFDSGIGGLTVASELIKILPDEDLIYLGDTARVPYGTRSKDTIIRFALEDSNFLLKRHVKALIVACNTISSVALNEIKRQSPVPVFDVVTYGIQEGIKKNRNNLIGVIGTNATINSQAYRKGINKLDKTKKVIEKACPLFVPFIEEGEIEGKGIEWIVDKYLKDFTNNKTDTLILGCTHYPLIAPVIQHYLKKITLINPAAKLAEAVRDYLTSKDLLNISRSYLDFSFTDLNPKTAEIAKKFLRKDISKSIHKVTIASLK